MLRLTPLILISAILATVLFIPAPTPAQQDLGEEYTGMGSHAINRRDYIIWRRELGWGTRPIIGDERYLEPISHLRDKVTWEMGKDKALLVAIWPVIKPCTVWMLVSQPSSPHLVKPVWVADMLDQTLVFWTDTLWTPTELCDYSGCPKIRFQSIRGKVGVRILDKRGAVTTKINK